MKATEQYFSNVLFIMLYKVDLTFEAVNEILRVTIQPKATEQHFPVMLPVYYTVQGRSNLKVEGAPLRIKATEPYF